LRGFWNGNTDPGQFLFRHDVDPLVYIGKTV